MGTHSKEIKKQVEHVQEKVSEHIAPKKSRTYRTHLITAYLLISSAAFIVLAILAYFFPYFPIDLKITKFVQQANNPIFTNLMSGISWIGYTPQSFAIIGSIIAIIYLFGLKWESLVSLLNIILVTGLNLLIKGIIRRDRPTIDLVHVASHVREYSFPSGHVMSYTAFYGFIFFLAFTLMKKSVERTLILIISGLVVILIAPSRIFLGAHWASDTFGAYLLGNIWLIAVVYIYRWGKKRYFTHQPVKV